MYLSGARALLQALTASLAMTLSAGPPSRPAPPGGPDWWRGAVFYEVYPRSFQDSDGDGIGDLPGLTARLDHLRDLGVDALWLTPVFRSPDVDYGYDVSDFRDIDPRYGSLADFDRLIAEAGRRGIRVLLDLVLNHTSDQHPWFQAARASRSSPWRDWYIWRDGRGPGRPPNNWQALFGGGAWQWDPATVQYYYHFFYPQQPDLNWRNPAIQEAMLEICRFWYRRGVAGFRLDAVDTLFEDPDLRDNPLLPGRNPFGDPNMQNLYNQKLEEGHRVLKALRQEANRWGAVLVGETYPRDHRELVSYYGDNDELQMPMDMLLAEVKGLSAPGFRRELEAVEALGIWPTFVINNHDLPRAAKRFGNGRDDDRIARVLAALLLTARCTPILYYGEEIGMVNSDPVRVEDVRDPLGRRGWPLAVPRDGCRTPMPWDGGPQGGFTEGTPWLPLGPDTARRNVAAQTRDPNSLLNFYRALTALRRAQPALRAGKLRTLLRTDRDLLAYLREHPQGTVLVVLNCSERPRALALAGETGRRQAEILLKTAPGPLRQELDSLTLEPYGVLVAALSGP